MVVLLVAFFVSGACGLAYEVVWTRLLGLAVGHTTVALTAVVAAFMGGLAVGGAASGRLLQWRGLSPRRLYVGLEIGIAALALVFPLQLSVVTTLAVQAARVWPSDAAALAVVRFLLAALAVVPATVLMGATLPAMVACTARLTRQRDVLHSAGRLYAVNTLGAVCGAAAAGFVLIERLGTFETTWVAAAGNLLAAIAVWAVGRSSDDVASEVRSVGDGGSSTHSLRRTGTRAVMVAYALSGCAALALQIVWTRALVFFAGSTTYAFSSMLVVFLGGVSFGSACATRVAGAVRRPAEWFVVLQAGLAVSAATSMWMLRAATPVIDVTWPPDASWQTLVVGNFLKACAAMALPTTLMGAAFPFAVRLSARGGDDGDLANLGRLYAWNTVGGIVGVTLAGVWLVPRVGIAGTVALAAMCALVSGVIVAARRHSEPLCAASLAVAAVVVGGVWIRGESALHVPVGSERLVFYEEGRSATISVLQEVTGTRTIFIDRVPVAGTDAIMLTDQKSLAHVPLLVHPEARRVLTVGFGSGGASWSFSRYPAVERIDAVEIDPSVFHAAPHLEDSNHGVWQDARFHLILEDARNYLASTAAEYDVISTDCTDLRYKSNANLYTVDYFTLARRRLRPGGVVTVWMPLGGLGGDTFRMAIRTFRQVFPHTTVWYMANQPTHYLLLVGTLDRLRPDVDAMARAMQSPAVRSDLAEIRLDNPLKLASSLVLDEDEVASLAGEGPVNTDRHPLLEFAAPRLAYRDALVVNLRSVVSHMTRGRQRWSGTDATLTALAPYAAAAPALIEGHARYQRGTFDYDGALAQYRLAADRNPSDTSVGPLIADVERTRSVWLREFDTRTTAGSLDARDWMAHAALLRQVGRLDDAVRAAQRATLLQPRAAEPWVRLAAVLSATGDGRGATAVLERAAADLPADPVLLSDLGATYNEQQRFADAAAVLRRSLGAQETADARNNLGVTFNGLGQPRDAIVEFGRALALDGTLARAWFNLGVAHASLGEMAMARRAYQRGLDLDPLNPRALYNLAILDAREGRLEESVAGLERAAAIDDRSADLHNELGRAYLAVGRSADAVRQFERSLELDPASEASRANLALARSQASGLRRR